MNTKFFKIAVIGLFVSSIGGSFASGWYLGGHQTAKMNNTYASLVNISECQGTACTPDKFLLLPNLSNADNGKISNVDFSPFWRTWQILNERYVNGTAAINSTTTKQATDQDRVWGAISGMVDSLGDPYTVFMPPQEKTKFEEDIRGNFSGVGMEVGYKDGVPTVIAPLPNSPAKKAGILAGDKVLKVDGEPTANLSLDEAINKIRGVSGTAVVLTILHDKAKESVDIKIVRAIITIPTIDTKTVTGKNQNDKIFVINLYNFSAQSASLFRTTIGEFAKSGSNKLILDLRGNPGGYLDAAVDMASWFLPQGKAVVRESGGAGKKERVYRSAGYDIFKNKNLKMVVLVDKGSASASEILAGALSEYGVAKLVGEKTFGKGSVQELVPITDDSSLKVTIARWLTPNGKSISQNGLDPDFVVKLPAVTATSTIPAKDTQFDRAVELLK
jgi:carboxyl-terminal processing protease